jgi:hypothetical protein
LVVGTCWLSIKAFDGTYQLGGEALAPPAWAS